MRQRLVTFNVNGIRSRVDSVLQVWEELEPTVLCLQETKCSPEQVPAPLAALPGTWQHWNGGPKGYSGTAILARREAFDVEPVFFEPSFDEEARAVGFTTGPRSLLCLYMPNGGKDYEAKLRFYDELTEWTRLQMAEGRSLWLCGDMNIAHTDLDIHPRDLPRADIGVRPEERAKFDALLATGLRDVFREAHPGDGERFTWWPYWRDMRKKNRGWRIDYHLASPDFARVVETFVHLPETGSDHAPLVCDVEL